MIDKSKLREYMNDNFTISTFEESPFIIVDSWNQLTEINRLFQGINTSENRTCSLCGGFINCDDKTISCKCKDSTPPYYQKKLTLDYDKLFGYPDSSYPFPINLQDINVMKSALETLDLIKSGQTSFIEWEWSLVVSPDIAQEIIKEWESNVDYDPVYQEELINDWLRDMINPVEWGFSDEYTTCSNCYQVIRTSPDSYDWQPDYIITDGEILCKNCVDPEDLITMTQEAIDSGDSIKTYPACLDIPEDFTRIPNPYDSDQYNSHWQNGMHSGMNDDPKKQGLIVRNVKYDGNPVYQIIFRIYPSQFYVEWDSYIRIDPNLDDSVREWVKNRLQDDLNAFSEMFEGTLGKYPYDIATLYQEALQDHSNVKRFNTITIDPENGTHKINSTDSFEEFTST